MKIYNFITAHFPFLLSAIEGAKNIFDMLKTLCDIRVQKKKGDDPKDIVMFENLIITKSNVTIINYTTSNHKKK